MNGNDIRKVFLILFLIAYGVSCLSAFLMGQMMFFWSLLGCGVSIGAGEIISVITTGKTLSTHFTKAMQEGNMKFVWGVCTITSLVFTMIFLGCHFWPWK